MAEWPLWSVPKFEKYLTYKPWAILYGHKSADIPINLGAQIIYIWYMCIQDGAPPSDVCWFLNPMNTIVISAINNGYGSYKPTYLTMGHHLVCVYIYPHCSAIITDFIISPLLAVWIPSLIFVDHGWCHSQQLHQISYQHWMKSTINRINHSPQRNNRIIQQQSINKRL